MRYGTKSETDSKLLAGITGCFAVIDESGRYTAHTPLTGVDNDFIEIRVIECGEGRYLLHDMGRP